LLQETVLRDRITRYFFTWHPLFPFLDGAYLIQCFDNATNMAKLQGIMTAAGPINPALSAFEGLSPEQGLVLSAMFLAVFALGRLDEQSPSDTCVYLYSASHAMTLGNMIIGAVQNSKVNDLFAIQALLAIQLYLYATRALRPAMHMSGILTSKLLSASLLTQNSYAKLDYIAALIAIKKRSPPRRIESSVNECSIPSTRSTGFYRPSLEFP
jgi:hypothetical protein